MSTAVPPPLEVLDALEPRSFLEPRKRIVNEDDMERFKWTQGYNDIVQFVYQLNRALCPRQPPRQAGEATPKTPSSSDPRPAVSEPGPSSSSMPPPNLLGFPRKPKDAELPKPETFTIHSKRDDPPSVKQFQSLLGRLKSLIDEAPPSKEPRRFGNASFRVWHRLLEERADGLLREFLPQEVLNYGYVGDVSPLVELRAYFLGSFGSSTRLDYGTGHELSFLAFLGCLWKLGGFKDGAGGRGGDIERSIVFGVFEPYLNLIRQLILTYTLEPAGTHGVWGLDDHFFLSYIFGSAQLTRPIAAEDEPMPQEGSVRGAPKPADVCKAEKVELYRAENMYFAAIGFINDVKKGPFWEHSPVLYNVSGIKDGWGKINKGMIKMFVAEVLGKFPVVQHFPFGSMFAWDLDPAAPEWARKEATTTKVAGRTDASLPAAGTQAPWAVAPQGGGGPVPRPGATQMPGSLPRPLARPGPSGGANSIPNVERRGGNA